MGFEDNSSHKLYLREISKVPLLTPEQEIELADRIKRGDEAARKQMIRANLRLVVKIAQDYSNYGLSITDLISEGNIGLMKAVERFNPGKGGKLSTYAAWWIKQSIKRALANQSKSVRLPVHIVDKVAKLRRIASMMAGELGRDPTDEELSEELGIPREKISLIREYGQRPLSLDAPVEGGDEGGRTNGDILPDTSSGDAMQDFLMEDVRAKIEQVLPTLKERERIILEERFGLNGEKPKTLEEVGRIFEVTRERIRQIEAKALGTMRTKLRECGVEMGENRRVPTERRKGAPQILPRTQVELEKKHFKGLTRNELGVLYTWYSTACFNKDPQQITDILNSQLSTQLSVEEVQALRERAMQKMITKIYQRVIKNTDVDNWRNATGNIMKALRSYLEKQ